MATMDQLETALRNADAAGDTTAAKRLAAEIIRMRGPRQGQQQPAPGKGNMYESPAPAPRSFASPQPQASFGSLGIIDTEQALQ